MRKARINMPTLGAIAATRSLLGFGVGLLLSARIPAGRRRALGWTLLGIGAVSTVPLAAIALRR